MFQRCPQIKSHQKENADKSNKSMPNSYQAKKYISSNLIYVEYIWFNLVFVRPRPAWETVESNPILHITARLMKRHIKLPPIDSQTGLSLLHIPCRVASSGNAFQKRMLTDPIITLDIITASAMKWTPRECRPRFRFLNPPKAYPANSRLLAVRGWAHSMIGEWRKKIGK